MRSIVEWTGLVFDVQSSSFYVPHWVVQPPAISFTDFNALTILKEICLVFLKLEQTTSISQMHYLRFAFPALSDMLG